MVVEQLSLQRAKLSFYTHKNSYLNDYCKIDRWNVNDLHKIQDIALLGSILPPRKQWSRPNKNSNRQRYTSSIELNKASIKNRVYIVHKEFVSGKIVFKDAPKWYQNLRYFLFELRLDVLYGTVLRISKPDIFPAKKNPDVKADTSRRPLAKFYLRDKIILSLTNKYLTKIFDEEFLDSSFAFRSKNSWKGGPTYHDAVNILRQYRTENQDNELYVAECDIQKFFDCLDHDIILKEYSGLKNIIEEKGHSIHSKAEAVFFAYLNCYSFNKDVWPKNVDSNYWIKHNDVSPNGNFEWVKEFEVIEDDRNKKKIGIPQGGALSGLMVNILLHRADLAIDRHSGWGREFLYLRYCDDMVIVHTLPGKCNDIFNAYIDILKTLSLIPHESKTLNTAYSKKFWGAKSRNVYAWSEKRNTSFPNSPWVSFLGYMVSFKGELKVRKKSIEKQEKKHILEAKKVIKKLNKQGTPEVLDHKKAIIQSFETKLYSMAVGRVDIKNYRSIPVDMCWAAGFQLIDQNKFTEIQLKKLDRSRKEAILAVKKYLKRRTAKLEEYLVENGITRIGPPTQKMGDGKDQMPKARSKIIYSKYPHSFYSILDRKKKED